MVRRFLAVSLALLLGAQLAFAQERVWVQIEAQPNLLEAEERARDYAATLPDVNGFYLGSGWYAIALGPYAPDDAAQLLRSYRAEGRIPRDSFVAFPSAFRQQFWPTGASALLQPTVQAPTTTDAPQVTVAPAVPEITPPDETPREARAGERLLTRSEREALQVALQWAGFYSSKIDGAFGPGTRNAMSGWQDANGFERTGVLTTLQRAALLKQYNAVLDGMGLQMVSDPRAGIEMILPMGVVAFDRYEPPFAQYAATGNLDAKVLMISQPGDQTTMFGLYDIMQTLSIVPLEGPRERKNDRFTLIGQNSRIVSHTEVGLADGEIKGFTLVWPAGDEERRTRILNEMRQSFTRIPGFLDPAEGLTDAQRIDLVAGLEVRKPRLSRSGFYVSDSGAVVTTMKAVASCERITLDGETEASVLAEDPVLGIAVLRPANSLAPMGVAAFQPQEPRLQSDVAVSGYSFEGVLGAPTMTFGKLADVQGLRGEPELARLAITPLPGDAGGPVVDATGGVLGMLLPQGDDNGRKLPDEVQFAADSAAILELVETAGLRARVTQGFDRLAPEDLTTLASDMTVLVSCWDD